MNQIAVKSRNKLWLQLIWNLNTTELQFNSKYIKTEMNCNKIVFELLLIWN